MLSHYGSALSILYTLLAPYLVAWGHTLAIWKSSSGTLCRWWALAGDPPVRVETPIKDSDGCSGRGSSRSYPLIYLWLDVLRLFTTQLSTSHHPLNMVFKITSDPSQAAKALFTVGDGFDELTPAPAFDYRTYKLDNVEAERQLALLIDGMTKVEDKTGRFVYQREYFLGGCESSAVGIKLIDSPRWPCNRYMHLPPVGVATSYW